MKTTIDTINEIFGKRKVTDDAAPKIKAISCKDGVSLSVQASRKHNCFPRTNKGPYVSVEVGFPTIAPPQSWAPFCKGDFDKKPCDTVYFNVPLKMVADFVDTHGGVKAEEAPKMVLPAAPALVHRPALAQRRYNLTVEDLGFRL